jgi:parallel beta-helix repeat protein
VPVGVAIEKDCSNCNVVDCIINGSEGLSVSGTGCTLCKNIITNSILGLYFSNDGDGNNVVYGNTITGTDYGIYCFNQLGDRNNIALAYENNIANNSYGIYCQNSSNNKFYHNNFINNLQNAFSTQPANCSQVWDDGYPSGGNYWSDYNGTDTYRGVYQNETGSDGIGDTPYVIDANNGDSYPLMKPYPWASHDIGITSATASTNVVERGYNVSINSMIFNYGNYAENFNVTLFANETTIGEISNIELASRDFTIVTFLWDTSNFTSGNCTVGVYAEPVQGETDTVDNLYVGLTVQIEALRYGGGGRAYRD